VIILQVNALLETLELKDSAQRKGHLALFNCLVFGHTKYNGVQRVYCNQFPEKPHYCRLVGSHRLDLVMIRPPGKENGAVLWSRKIQFGTHRFCSLSLPPHKPTPGPNHLTVLSCRRWKHMTILRMVIIDVIVIIVIIVYILFLLKLLSLLSLWRLLKLFKLLNLLHLLQ
jgi:hypothetical protein